MEQPKKKGRHIDFRVSDTQYEQIYAHFKKTTFRKLGEYARAVLLGKPVTTIVRNRSLDDLMAELIQLRKELNAAGNNFNQAVKKLNSLGDQMEVRRWATVYEQCRTELQGSILLIENHIAKMADTWLQ